MATTDIIHLQTLRSKDVLSGSSANLDVARHFDGETSPKLPSGEQLEYGDIALNIAKGYEIISTKNYDGEIVYLPFNLGDRTLSLEESTKYILDKLSIVSGTVLSQESGLTEEINNRNISESLIKDSINELSSSTDTKISQLTQSIDDKSKDIVNYVDVNVSGLSIEIQSVSGKIESKFDKEIESLSNAVSSFSGITSGTISSQIEKEVKEAQSELQKSIDEGDIVRAAAIAKMNSTIGLDVHGGYKFDVDYLSGRTIVNAIEAVDARIDDELVDIDIRMYTLSSLTKSINSKYESLSGNVASLDEKLVKNINEVYTALSGEVKSLNEKIDSDIDDVYDNVEDALETLSNKIDSTQSGLTEYVDVKIDNLSKDISIISGQIGDNIAIQVKNLSGDLITLSSQTIDNFNVFASGVTKQLSTVDEKISGAVVESETKYEEKLNNVEERLQEDELVHAAAFAKLNQQFGFDNNGNYTSDFDELSARTVSNAIDYIFEAWKDTDYNVGKTLDGISKYEKELKEQKEDYTSKYLELSGKTGDGFDNLSAETDIKLTKLSTDLNERIDSLSAASTSDLEKAIKEVSDNLSAETKISRDKENELSSATEDLKSQLSESVAQVEQDLQIVSGRSEELANNLTKEFSGLCEIVSGVSSGLVYTNENVESLRDELKETELVRAAAVANINRSLGFDIHGNYTPYFEELSGRTVSDAIDYVLESCQDEDYQINKAFDKISNCEETLKKQKEDYTEKYIELSGKTGEGFDNLSAKTDVKLSELNSSLTQKINTLSASTSSDLKKEITKVNSEISDLRQVVDDGHIEIIKQHTKDIKELSWSIDTKEERLQSEINNLSASTDVKANALDSKINDTKSDFLDKINALDDKVDSGFTGVSGTTNEIKENLYNDELVHAAAFNQLKSAMGLSDNGTFVPYSDGLKGRNMSDGMDYLYDYVKELEEKVQSLSDMIDESKILHMKPVTYENLKRMARRELLDAGQTYKITNYQATVNDSLSGIATTREDVVASSATTNSGFYIIVKATSVGTLSEHALAMAANVIEDEYFDENNVEAWDIKYDIYNDTSRFEWANPDGFGVIYYMKDEFGNEANYDFKNIVFLKQGIKTFTFNNKNNNTDLSLTVNAHDNKIEGTYTSNNKLTLNNIILNGKEIYGNKFMGGCSNITFNSNYLKNCLVGDKANGTIISEDKDCKLIGYNVIDYDMISVKNKNLNV